MKFVNFNYIKARNFLSIGDEEVEVVFKKGINVITGNNKDKVDRRNGVGKSTIADSIHFAIFGETIREIPKSNIVNNITKKGTYVELSFSVTESNKVTEYKIIRSLKPTKCFLYINDEDKTESTIINTTNRIKEILYASQEIFQNCVIMSINTTLPFMAQKKVEKRKFIEGILKLEVFSQMLQAARNEHNDVLRDYDSTNKELNHQKNYKDIVSKQLEDKKSDIKNRISRYNSDINKKKNKLILLEDQITEPNLKLVSDIKEKKSNFDNKISDIDTAIEREHYKKMQYETEIKMFERTFKQIGTDKSSCPVCLHEISSEDLAHIEDEKNKISNDIADRESDIDEILLQVDKLKNYKNDYRLESDKCKSYLKDCLTAIESNKRVRASITEIKEEILDIEKEIKDAESSNDNDLDLENQIKDYTTKVDMLEEQVESLSKNNKVLEFVKFILSEEGVKSFIVKKILNILNGRLLYYLKKMDANCVCKFNEFFEEEIKNDKGQECSYFNFSGAERKNIDLACLFTFMDIRRMQGDVSYNLVMFDELLDSSLDEKGVELVLNILKERVETYNESIYIISHRKESAKESSGEVIYLEKTNGITRKLKYNN